MQSVQGGRSFSLQLQTWKNPIKQNARGMQIYNKGKKISKEIYNAFSWSCIQLELKLVELFIVHTHTEQTRTPLS